MTLATTTNKATFQGSGTTGPFSFTFPFYDDADLAVYKVVSGVPSLLAITTDYTVAGAGEETGGSVTTVAAVAVGETLVVMRDLTLNQLTDLVNGGSFYADTIEEVFDRLTMFCQQLNEALSRTIKLPIGSTVDTDSLADNMLIVASNEADIGTVADNIADVNTVADNIVDVGIVADNVVDVTNFSDVYLGAAASDPATRTDGSALQAGDMYFNTVTKVLMVYDGVSAWSDSHAPVPFTVYEADLDFSDITTADVSISEHGLCPKAPNDTAKFLRGDATWAALPAIVAVHSATLTTRMDITSVIPFDNTIPQNTEGTEVFTVTLTPTAATNKLIFLIDLTWMMNISSACAAVVALFQDTTADALDATVLGYASASLYGANVVSFSMAAGTKSETTFKVRAGLSSNPSNHHLYINGNNSINPFFGGKCVSSITVLEVKA